MMKLIQERDLFRADDLLAPDMPKFCEVVEGELVIMTPAGKKHNRVASNFERIFAEFCERHPELDYGGDNDGFLLGKNPDTLLSPDASLYRRRPESEKTWLEFAPEIVVEVISPDNSQPKLASKRKRFFDGGTEQFWLVDADARAIDFYFRDGRRLSVSGDETVQCEGIAQGLSLNLSEAFKLLSAPKG